MTHGAVAKRQTPSAATWFPFPTPILVFRDFLIHAVSTRAICDLVYIVYSRLASCYDWLRALQSGICNTTHHVPRDAHTATATRHLALLALATRNSQLATRKWQ